MISFILGLLPQLVPTILRAVINGFEKKQFDENTKKRVLEYIKIIETRYGGSAGDDANDWEKLDGDVDKWIAEQRAKQKQK